jgi:hypothetical protein
MGGVSHTEFVRNSRLTGSREADWVKRLAIGTYYTREEIHSLLGGGLQDYLPHSNGRITCGAFRLDTNPDAPNEILPGTGPGIEYWAHVLCEQTEPIPVFIKVKPSRWNYVGDYRVASWTADPAIIADRAVRASRSDITRVVRLERVDVHEPPSVPQQLPFTLESRPALDLDRRFLEAVNYLLGTADTVPRQSELRASADLSTASDPDDEAFLREALYRYLPSSERISKEALIEAVAQDIGQWPAKRALRSQLNKLLNTEKNAGHLNTDWTMVWRD